MEGLLSWLVSPVVWLAVLLAIVLLLLLRILAGLYRKVGPNQALIVYGLGHPKVVKGGGAIVWPMVQSADELSLELMSFDVAPPQDLYTQQGVAVTVEAVAQIKVKSDHLSILTAAEQFLRKSPEDRQHLIRLSMEGHLRGIVGQLTVEEIVKQPEMVAGRMRENVAADMDKMGLEVISFTIKDVKDKNEYIANMGRPDVARVRRNADIATAEAERDTAIRQSETMREAAIARAAADQERVIAELASQTRQAEAERDLALKRAEYERSVKTAQAQSDKAYDIQAAIMQQQIAAEQVRVERVQREEQIKVQEAEIQRRERELAATVLKQAEAERRRVELMAEADRQRRVLEAQGQSEAARAQGTAQAEVIRLQGQAEAEVIRAKGEAEAAALATRADAYQGFNQAAVLDKMLTGMPEIARAFAEPLGKVDKITIVSTGGSGGVGANQMIEDLTRMVAQAPALFETLTGQRVSDLLNRLPALADGSGPNGHDRTSPVLRDAEAVAREAEA
ncbi:MAG: SPFH domain-containing protein [Chloroflexota bacterium]|nr:SPFH domain-containing protein [Chloroflexota bacterium]